SNVMVDPSSYHRRRQWSKSPRYRHVFLAAERPSDRHGITTSSRAGESKIREHDGPGGVTPNAKSVSERLWQISHDMRPNPGNVSPMLISPAPVIQEVARFCYAYNAWQTSHPVRPNTLAAMVRSNPISVRAHHTVHHSFLTSFLRPMICREEAERWRSPAAGSRSEERAKAGGSQVQRFVGQPHSWLRSSSKSSFWVNCANSLEVSSSRVAAKPCTSALRTENAR